MSVSIADGRRTAILEPPLATGRRIVLLTAEVPPQKNGVGDYTYHLGRQLAQSGHEVVIVTTRGQRAIEEENGRFRIAPTIARWDLFGMGQLLRVVRELRPDVVNVQWVPFMWGRYGINFALPLAMMALASAGYRIITTVHEAYVPFDTWSRVLMGPPQRLQLVLLVAGSTKVLATASGWRRALLRYLPWRSADIGCVPVGANIVPGQDQAPDRVLIRKRLGLHPNDIVVTVFSPFSAGKMLGLVRQTCGTLGRRYRNLKLVILGCSAEEFDRQCPSGMWDGPVIYTGFLPPADVSNWLWATDLLLSPFGDGVSTRRGSVMAALAHAVPVVSTRGFMTDPHVFDGAPIALVDINDERGFVEAAERLIVDERARRALGRAAASFYEAQFSWARIAQRFEELCLLK